MHSIFSFSDHQWYIKALWCQNSRISYLQILTNTLSKTQSSQSSTKICINSMSKCLRLFTGPVGLCVRFKGGPELKPVGANYISTTTVLVSQLMGNKSSNMVTM